MNRRMSNKSFERTARQLAFHQSCVVSLRLRVAGGQPLNSSVRRNNCELRVSKYQVRW